MTNLRMMGVLIAAGAALGCSPTAPAKPAAPPPAAAVQLLDTSWGDFNSKRYQLTVPFPDGKTWRIDDHSSEWLEATHPSNTLFRARVWFEHDRVTRQACEKRVRFWVPDLPTPTGSDVIDERDMADFPAPGFTSHLVVGLATPPGAPASTVGGVALAIGAFDHKCVVLLFTSMSRGASSAPELASRLEIGSRMIEGVVLHSDHPPDRQPFDGPPQ